MLDPFVKTWIWSICEILVGLQFGCYWRYFHYHVHMLSIIERYGQILRLMGATRQPHQENPRKNKTKWDNLPSWAKNIEMATFPKWTGLTGWRSEKLKWSTRNRKEIQTSCFLWWSFHTFILMAQNMQVRICFKQICIFMEQFLSLK